MAYPYYQQYYQPPMPDQLAQLRQNQYQPAQPMQPPMQNQQPSIVWVPNEQAAREYLVAPNSAVTLWDSSAPVVYLKQADASGKPTLTTYDLVERSQRPVQAPAVEYATKDDISALAARIGALEAVKETPKPTKKTTVKEEAE